MGIITYVGWGLLALALIAAFGAYFAWKAWNSV